MSIKLSFIAIGIGILYCVFTIWFLTRKDKNKLEEKDEWQQ